MSQKRKLLTSNGMNNVLERQLKKAFGSLEAVPKGLGEFLELVSNTYDSYDQDHTLIERSLEISSKELGELNEKLRNESVNLRKNLSELERMNKLMIDRELKMVELKKENALLKKSHS